MADARNLVVVGPASLTPAEISAWLREHHPNEVLRAAAEILFTHADDPVEVSWDDYDDAAALCQRLADRLERARPNE